MDLQLRCKVFPGQFSDEFAVSAEQADGSRFSLFTPVRLVDPDEPPTRDRSVNGWLKVSLYERGSNRAVVRLPRESFESGRFVTARPDQFRTWPAET
jgi:hypothetical protein